MAIIQTLADIFGGKETTAINQPWPPDGHGARISGYATYQAIFDGDHVNAFDDRDDLEYYGIYIVCNIGSLIVKAINDLLFGEPFDLDYPEGTPDKAAELVEEIVERNKLHTACSENGIDGMTTGDALFVCRKENELAVIDPVPVTTWVPDLNPDNVRDVRSHIFGWKRTVMEGKKEVNYLRQVIHTPGQIQNLLWLMKGDRLVHTVHLKTLYDDPPPEVEETGVEDDMLVVHVPNFRPARSYFGWSEYKGMKSMFSALNARLSQQDYKLTYNTDPILELARDTFNYLNKKGGGKIDKRGLKVIPRDEDSTGKAANWITNDAPLGDAETFIDGLIDKILLLSETGRQLVGMDGGGGPESGRALKVRLLRSLAKVNRKRRYYDHAIPKVLELAQRLEGVKDPIKPKVKWKDSLPQNIMELLEAEEAKLRMGITSRKKSIETVDGVDEAEAEKRVEEIDSEDAVASDKMRDSVAGKKTPINVQVGSLEEV